MKKPVTEFVTEYAFNFRLPEFLVKLQDFTKMALKKPVIESAFSFRLWQSLFLISFMPLL